MLLYWKAEMISGVWLQGPGIPQFIVDHWGVEVVVCWFLTQVWGVPKVAQSCWLARPDPAGPRVGSGLCCWIGGFGFCVFLLLDEAGLEAWSGLLVGGPGICSLVNGARFWSPGGLGHV